MNAEIYIKFAAALAAVLALIAAAAWLARRLGFGTTGPSLSRSKRRLAVVETVVIDAKRRLVLIRRDDTEHLLLLGPGSETVIETGIAPPALAPASAGAAPSRDASGPASGDKIK